MWIEGEGRSHVQGQKERKRKICEIGSKEVVFFEIRIKDLDRICAKNHNQTS